MSSPTENLLKNFKRGNLKTGFTLAETLIAMTIIGIIAVITIPIISEHHEKITVVTQLRKFHSNINQAIKLRNVQTGDDLTGFQLNSKGSTALLNFYEENFAPYMIDSSHNVYDWQYIAVGLNDGSGFYAYTYDYDRIYILYCVKFSKCKHGASKDSADGRNTFLFTLHSYRGDVITAWDSWHTDPREYVLKRCKEDPDGRRNSCSRLIEMDGWEIKKDYPWKKT